MDSHEDDWIQRPRIRTRNIGVTIVVGLMIVYYSFCVSVNLTPLLTRAGQARLADLYHFPGWVIPAVTVCFALNVTWAFRLLQGRKWAFYALLVTSLCLYSIPLVGGGWEQLMAAWRAGAIWSEEGLGQLVNAPLLSLILLAVLFVLLRIGGPRSTWNQLE